MNMTIFLYKKTGNVLALRKNKTFIDQISIFKTTLFLVFAIFFISISSTKAEIFTNVFLRDSNTPVQLIDANFPHIYKNIMVGTKLKIIVSSDTSDYWTDGGALAIEETYWPYGYLTAGEPLPAAGINADVFPWEEELPPPVIGFILYTAGVDEVYKGDWFRVDYDAVDIGNCSVGFYDFYMNWSAPIYNLSFNHVPSCDYNNDTIVNFQDFRIFVSHWLEINCQSSGWCEGADLDTNGSVEIEDLMRFCEFWLEKTR